jgi:hypothetical protein
MPTHILGGRGFAPLEPLLGLCPGPAGDLKRSPDLSPTHAPPNPKSWIDIQLSLKYIHTGQTEMLCSHLGNAYSILT